MALENHHRVIALLRGLFALQLQHEAVAEVFGANAGGIELAHGVEGLAHERLGDFGTGADGDVVGDGLWRARQTAVVVEISYDILSQSAHGGGELEFAELPLEALGKSLGRGVGLHGHGLRVAAGAAAAEDGVGVGAVVLAVIVDAVGRRGIGCVGRCLAAGFEGGVLVELTAHLLFYGCGVHLQHLHIAHLQRRQRLCQRLFLGQ